MRWSLSLIVMSVVAASVTPSASASPGTWTCADVGGAFVAHGIDGRGDCMSADPRPRCHLSPSEQPGDGNYLAELTMTPPFPSGVLSNQAFVPIMINEAENKDCWRLPS
jgi:hypothetical protein